MQGWTGYLKMFISEKEEAIFHIKISVSILNCISSTYVLQRSEKNYLRAKEIFVFRPKLNFSILKCIQTVACILKVTISET